MPTYRLSARKKGVTRVIDSWPLKSETLEKAKVEADSSSWGHLWDDADEFIIEDETGAQVARRAFEEKWGDPENS